ncbi:MAG: lysophospholipid acyltransferase family protein [Planctomycetota bacterium]
MSSFRPGWFYLFCRALTRLALRLLYGIRAEHADRVPAEGPVLLVANHVSFLDPPIVGSMVERADVAFLARASLFKPPLSTIIRALHTLPIRDNEGDVRAIRQVIDLLAAGRPVLIFPEGSRTHDGALQPFREGFRLIARRAKCPVVPVAIEGAFHAWPRRRALPRMFGARLMVRYGEPIPAERASGPDGNALIEQTIDAMRLELRAALREATRGRFPPAGIGDLPLAEAEAERAKALEAS